MAEEHREPPRGEEGAQEGQPWGWGRAGLREGLGSWCPSAFGVFFLGETAWCCARLFTLKPTEGSSQPCPALLGLSSGAQTFWDFFFQT